MRLIIIFTTVIFLFTAVSGCAGKRQDKRPEKQEFVTDIKEDGSKRFMLTLITRANKGSGGDRANHKDKGRSGKGGGGRASRGKGEKPASGAEQYPRGGASRSGQSEQMTEEQVMALLDTQLAETSYCRNGYILLEFSQLRGETFASGECQESASEEDKERWQ